MTIFGAMGVWTMKSSLDKIADDQFTSLKIAATANEKATRRHQLAFEILAESTPADRANLQQEFKVETQNMSQLLDQFRPFVDGPDVPRFAAIEENFKQYNEREDKLFEMLTDGQRQAAEDFLQGQMSNAFDKSDGVFDKLVQQQADDVDAAQVVADTTSQRAYLSLLSSAAVGSIMIAGFAFWIARCQIIRPIDRLSHDMKGLAEGDVSIAVTGHERGDEIGGMARAVEVFKQAGLAQKRTEQESVSAREETERRRIESEQRATMGAREAFVAAVRASFQSLSQGDLTTRLDPNRNPDDVEVCELFNESVSQIEDAVGSVVGAIGAIRTGLGEITGASNDLSQRTEQQRPRSKRRSRLSAR